MRLGDGNQELKKIAVSTDAKACKEMKIKWRYRVKQWAKILQVQSLAAIVTVPDSLYLFSFVFVPCQPMNQEEKRKTQVEVLN
jgi:hypothetical protein